MKKLIGLVLIFGLCSCTSPAPGPGPTPNPLPAIGCQAETAITSAVAASIGTTLSCTNTSAIQGDIMTVLGKANLCAAVPSDSSKNRKGPIGDIMCPLVLNSVTTLLTGKIPATWGCDPSAKIADVSAMINAACSKAIGI